MENESRAAGSPDFGTLLRSHRLTAGLSQEALAERAGMSTHGVRALERGYRRTPQRGTLALLADALALSDEQRRELETAAARWVLLRNGSRASVVAGPWPDTPSNLPLSLTSFVGRERELDEIAALVREHRLVTLTGSGGVGKTQTALQVATALGDGWPVRFVGLAPLSDPSLVTAAIASALRVQEVPNRPLLETLRGYLKNNTALLILDNCEHVVTEAASVAHILLTGCPRVRILATSREPLRAAGERTFRLASLSVPSPEAASRVSATDAVAFGAIVLFTDRARAADHRFTLNDENAPIVAGICRRVDGIPLAIELAAARVAVLPPQLLAQKLEEQFRVLTGGNRTALPRQQTMRATIDWSYDLLSEREQRLFRRLAVFVGGWTLEASESVCTDATIVESDVFGIVSQLVDKSLVVVAHDSTRLHLLETTRAFALEKLALSDEVDGLERQHAQWTAELGDRAFEIGCIGSMSQYYEEFASEAENARSAIDWALAKGEAILGARILAGFSRIYQRLAGYAELRTRLEVLLNRLGDSADEVRLAARVCFALSIATGGGRSLKLAERAVEISSRGDETAVAIRSLSVLAFALAQVERTDEAEASLDRAVQMSDEGGFSGGGLHAHLLRMRGIVASCSGRVDAARQFFTESIALANALGDATMACSSRLDMAVHEFQCGNVADALDLVIEVSSERVESDTDSIILKALGIKAACRIALGDVGEARTDAREALRLARGCLPHQATIAIEHLATIAALGANPRRGALLCGYADGSYARLGYAPTEVGTRSILVDALRRRLSTDEIAALAMEGVRLSEERATDEALDI